MSQDEKPTDHFIAQLLDGSAVLKGIFGGMGDAVSIMDTHFSVLYQNDAHARLAGNHRGERCYKACHHRDGVCEGCPLAMVFQDGESHSTVKSRATDRGAVFVEITASPIRDANGEIAAAIEIVRNITDRARADRELTNSKQMLEDIAEGITESILLLSKDYRILWANKAALRQTGMSLGELTGRHCYEATHHQEHVCNPPEAPCPVHRLLKTGGPGIEEHLHYDEGGEKIFVEVSAYPITDETGEIVRFVHISKDITERKRLERVRENLIAELQDALVRIRTLKGLIPICSSCKKIRDDSGYWNQIEAYISEHSDAEFSHSLCPQCANKLYGGFIKDEK